MTQTPYNTLTKRQTSMALMAVLLAVLLASMNQTIVSTAGPAIQTALNIENSLYSWITTAYLLASTTLVPIYGKLSDLVGRKPILILGTVIFIAGSVVCGTSGSVGMLIAGRAIQGLGGAALLGLMYAVIADLYPPEQRSKFTGLIGAAFSLSTVLGSIVGGYVTDHFGWHNVFFISVPLGVLTLIPMLLMPTLKQERERKPIDLLGAMLLSVFSVTLLLGLTMGKTSVGPGESGWLWGSWQILTLLGSAVLALVLFILTELKVQDPIINVRLFRNRTIAIANLTTFILGVVFFAATVFLPLFMVNVVGLSATNAGLTTFPLTIGLVLSAIVSGQMYARTRKMKPIIFAGSLILMLGFVLMGFTLTPHSTQFELTWKMIVVGMGLGPVLPMLTLAIQSAIDPRDIGQATGTNNFLRSLGSTIGVAVLGTLFASTLKSEINDTVEHAKKELPSSMQSQFSVTGNSGKKGNSAQSFDAPKLKKEATAKLQETRTRYVAALQDHDAKAIQALLNDPKTPKELRDVLKNGGFEGTIQKAFQAQRDLMRRAIVDRDPRAIARIVEDRTYPQELKALVQQGVGAQVSTTIGHQRDLLTRALLFNDPAAVREVLASPSTPAALRTTLQNGGVAAQVKKGFEAQRVLFKKALLEADPRAIQTLLANPEMPAELKNALQHGGIQGNIRFQFEQQKSLIREALLKNDPAATSQILNNPALPAELKNVFQNGGVTAKVKAGFAGQRALFTRALLKNDRQAVQEILNNKALPAELKGLFQNGGLEARVKAGMEQQKDLLTRAIQNNDPQAIEALLKSPSTPESLRKTLAAGGVRAAVKQGVEAQKTSVDAAIMAGNLDPVLQSPQLPEALKKALSALPVQAFATPEARQATVKQINASLDQSESAAEEQAIQTTLQQTQAGLDAAYPAALQQTRETALQKVLDGLNQKEQQTLKTAPEEALNKILTGLNAKEQSLLKTAPQEAYSSALAKLDAREPTVAAQTPLQALETALVKLDQAEQQALKTAPEEALKKVLKTLDAKEQDTLKTVPASSLNKILKGLDEAKTKIIPVIDEIAAGIKQSFTDAVSLLYQVGLWVTLLATAIAMLLPEGGIRKVSRDEILEDEFRSVEV